MSDYEIRVLEPSDVDRSYGCDYPLYIVWDLQADKRVPFSTYRRHDQAVARIIKMRDRRDRLPAEQTRNSPALNGCEAAADPEVNP